MGCANSTTADSKRSSGMRRKNSKGRVLPQTMQRVDRSQSRATATSVKKRGINRGGKVSEVGDKRVPATVTSLETQRKLFAGQAVATSVSPVARSAQRDMSRPSTYQISSQEKDALRGVLPQQKSGDELGNKITTGLKGNGEERGVEYLWHPVLQDLGPAHQSADASWTVTAKPNPASSWDVPRKSSFKSPQSSTTTSRSVLFKVEGEKENTAESSSPQLTNPLESRARDCVPQDSSDPYHLDSAQVSPTSPVPLSTEDSHTDTTTNVGDIQDLSLEAEDFFR